MARPQKISDDEILDAARRCFVAHGPAASTDRIAEELGVSSAALFKRFGTKERLMREALMPRAPQFLSRLSEGPGPQELPEQLRRLAAEILGFFNEMLPCMMVLRASVDPADLPSPDGTPLPLHIRRALATWLERARDSRQIASEVDPMALATALLGGLQSRAFMSYLSGGSPDGADDQRYVRDLIQILWRGASPRAAGPDRPASNGSAA